LQGLLNGRALVLVGQLGKEATLAGHQPRVVVISAGTNP